MSEPFVGRLFGPDLDGAGLVLEARWQGDGLVFTLPEGPLCSGTLAVEAAGFNRQALRVSWEAPEGSYAFFLEPGLEQRRLVERAPKSLQEQLARAVRQRQKGTRGLRVAFGALGAISLLLLIGTGLAIGYAPTLAAKATEQLPAAEERRLGEIVLQQTRLQATLLDRGPAVTALEQLGGKLTRGSRWNYRYHVALTQELNAFAAPGGIVVVNRGLIEAAGNAEELAGLLAHEIAHAELRHGTQALVKSLGMRALVGLWLGGLAPDYQAMASQFAELKFSRDAEREADREALRRLREARIDPAGMARLFERLATQNPVAPPAFLSTHPALAERLDWLKSELSRDGALAPLPLELDYGEVKASLSR